MSKKRQTAEDFCDSIDSDLSWRKKELINTKSSVETAKAKAQAVEIRKGTLLLYAHWEGFIKASAIAYLNYIVGLGLKKRELRENFLYIMFRHDFMQCADSPKMHVHINAIQKLTSDLDSHVNFPVQEQIKTCSNLKYDILVDIFLTLGIDYERYSSKEQFINQRLLDTRNSIAHGNYLCVTKDEFLESYSIVFELLENIKTDLQNACVEKRYLRSSA